MRLSRRNILLPAVLALFFMQCQDLQRDNILDPKNSRSQRPRTVLVESFVNESGGDVVQLATLALERLRREYEADDFILLEHHIQKTADTDPYAQEQSYTRYTELVPQVSRQGLPHVFFDGSQAEVQGASEEDIAYLRYKTELDKRLLLPAYFTIEAKTTLDEGAVTVWAQIARLGDKNARHVTVKIAVAEDIFHNGRFVVRAFLPALSFGTMRPTNIEEIRKEIALDPDWNLADLVIVIIVQNSVTKEVYHIASTTL